MHRTSIILLTAVALTLTASTSALAAPDHSFALNGTEPPATWQGAPQTTMGGPFYVAPVRDAIPCRTPAARPCEEVLLDVRASGRLTVAVEGAADTDVDLFLYESDAAGSRGDLITADPQDGPEKLTIAARPGHYLAVVDYYRAINSDYSGSAQLQGPPAVPPDPPPVAAAPPGSEGGTTPTSTAPGQPARTTPSSKRTSRRKACLKKAKRVRSAKRRKRAIRRCSRR